MDDTHRSFYVEVGRRIRLARTRRKPKMTQQALAKLVSLTRTSITNVEKGRQKFLLHTLADIASALNVEPSSLLPANGVDAGKHLDRALKDMPGPEKAWVKSIVIAAEKERKDVGS